MASQSVEKSANGFKYGCTCLRTALFEFYGNAFALPDNFL
jgi:hypothetical protein